MRLPRPHTRSQDRRNQRNRPCRRKTAPFARRKPRPQSTCHSMRRHLYKDPSCILCCRSAHPCRRCCPLCRHCHCKRSPCNRPPFASESPYPSLQRQRRKRPRYTYAFGMRLPRPHTRSRCCMHPFPRRHPCRPPTQVPRPNTRALARTLAIPVQCQDKPIPNTHAISFKNSFCPKQRTRRTRIEHCQRHTRFGRCIIASAATHHQHHQPRPNPRQTYDKPRR